MKQLLQNLRDGSINLVEIPCPQARRGHLLIQSSCSVISAGTERMLVEFGKANLISKGRQQPERVKQVLQKIRTDGFFPTLDSVFARLDEPLALGYCHVGRVIEVGEGVTSFQVGDRVVSNGSHAEVVCVPKNLCVRIPDAVTDENAAFAVLAAVGLQGIRLANPTLGETVVVLGLGLVGQMTVQMLKANGCRVIGFDTNSQRVALAREQVASTDLQSIAFEVLTEDSDPVTQLMEFTQGRGADAVLITASTTSSQPVHNAAQMCRKRGRIVLVGVTGLELNRADFFQKELSFQVSCSYGPGRYDPMYEEQGHDYPLGFVRWTEGRNLEAVLDLMMSGRLNVDALISDRVKFSDARQAYEKLINDPTTLGMVLQYPELPPISPAPHKENRVISLSKASPSVGAGQVGAAVIGAGQFTKLVLLPALKATEAALVGIASAGGMSAKHLGQKFGFEQITTDYHLLLSDASINTVFITTPHHQHARMVAEALEAGKHVFVEKPLAIDREGLDAVCDMYQRIGEGVNGETRPLLMVGFNRRFAPQVIRMKALLQNRSAPLTMTMLVNAGMIPSDHWTQDVSVGGGRIIGEACHFLDLMAFLAESPIVEVSAMMMGSLSDPQQQGDTMSITLRFGDGSVGTVHYFANGHKGYPKEKLEVFNEGKILTLHNFKRLSGYGWRSFRRMSLRRQDKGHLVEIHTFIDRVTNGGGPLIPFEQLYNVTLATFAAVESAKTSQIVDLNEIQGAN